MPETPQTPSAPNWGPQPTPPPGWSPTQSTSWPPPQPGWTPQHQMGFMTRPGSMEMLSRLAKILGLALLFVGALVAVVFGSAPGNCFQTGSNCSASGSNFPAQLAWVTMAGKALFVLGLGAIAFGALLKLRTDRWPSSGRAEEVDFVLADRRANTLTFLVAVVLLLVLTVTINGLPPVPIP